MTFPSQNESDSYTSLLREIKVKIKHSRFKTALKINRELIELYWEIGKTIVLQQQTEGWGKAVVDKLGSDLQREFPGQSGFSARNLWYMRNFYLAYSKELPILQQAVAEFKDQNLQQLVAEIEAGNLPEPLAEIPWGHNTVLLDRLEDSADRFWYALKTRENCWSRAVLVHQIETKLIGREGWAITNFKSTLSNEQSELANQIIKDPYHFGFLNLENDIQERELEKALIVRMKEFLLELGNGFSFMGNQYHLEVGGQDYYLDLLFYHIKLRRFIVIDLKVNEFKPEYSGKMNFYLAAVDDQLGSFADESAIGLILCKDRNEIIVEYALRNIEKPIGVAAYTLLPEPVQSVLPSPEELKNKLADS